MPPNSTPAHPGDASPLATGQDGSQPTDREDLVSERNVMIRLRGQDASFRCDCGGNVFRREGTTLPPCYRCNSCDDLWVGEP